ncbi:MAG: isomerizing glutamine--fructose-6-phosphate transaminase, partial [Nitrospirae bacterium]
MCGIIGYFGTDEGIEVVIDGLKRLEYRGYDSAGVAYFNGTGFEIKRRKGKIRELEPIVRTDTKADIAIGHTRWATHGEPSDENAHPHSSDTVVLVHNGIIENYKELKERLIGEGYKFQSKTDTEVVAHLIDLYHRDMPLEEAVRKATVELSGAYAIVVVSKKEPRKMVGVRKESPLVLGIGQDEFFLASDVPAFLQRTRRVVFLEDGDMVVIGPGYYRIETVHGQVVERPVTEVPWSPALAEKAGYKHFMHKEIHEQPVSLANTLRGRIDRDRMVVVPEEFGLDIELLRKTKRIFLVGCGTSWHAALVGKYL